MKTRIKFAWLLGQFLSAILPLMAAPASGAADPAPAAAVDGDFAGRVVEAISAAGYTYVQVDTGTKKLWAAANKFAVAKGDVVKVVGAFPMVNFHSKSLNRDFEVIYFTGTILNITAGDDAGAAAVLPPGHPALPGQTSPALPPNHPAVAGQPSPGPALDLAGISRVEGGRTIQEIINDSAELAGQRVKVRGRVVKYNERVLDRNWLHIRDASGSPATRDNDLTVTTDAKVKVGDTVVVTGKVAINRDFGATYKYAVMLEEAQVIVE
jgi:hypothetical protein